MMLYITWEENQASSCFTEFTKSQESNNDKLMQRQHIVSLFGACSYNRKPWRVIHHFGWFIISVNGKWYKRYNTFTGVLTVRVNSHHVAGHHLHSTINNVVSYTTTSNSRHAHGKIVLLLFKTLKISELKCSFKSGKHRFNPADWWERSDVLVDKYFDIWRKFGQSLKAGQLF